MNTDFRLSVGLFTHPKFLKLKRRLGDAGALGYITLLSFVAQNHPDGALGRMNAEDVALAGQYNGACDEFVRALIEVRLVEQSESGEFSIHDWKEHNPWAASAPVRSEKAKAAAVARWSRGANSNPDVCSEHATGMRQASGSNAPSPNHLHNQSIPSSSNADAREETPGAPGTHAAAAVESGSSNGSGYRDDQEPDPFDETTPWKSEAHGIGPSRKPKPKSVHADDDSAAAAAAAVMISAAEADHPEAAAWVLHKCRTEAKCAEPWIPYRAALWKHILSGEIPPGEYVGFTAPPSSSESSAAYESGAGPGHTKGGPVVYDAETRRRYWDENRATVEREAQEFFAEKAAELQVDVPTVEMFVTDRFHRALEEGSRYKRTGDPNIDIGEYSRFLWTEADVAAEFWKPLLTAAGNMAA